MRMFQYGELRHLMPHSMEQMGHRAEATRISRFERSHLKAPGFAGGYLLHPYPRRYQTGTQGIVAATLARFARAAPRPTNRIEKPADATSSSRGSEALHGLFNVNGANLPRRRFLHLAGSAATLSAVSRMAWAQAYPSRPVRIVVGFPPGGLADIVARLLSKWLLERLGRQFVIENRPGAGGNIGTEAVVHAPPDGYTLLFVGSFNAINITLYDRLSFNFIRDVTPIASISRSPNVMVVSPWFPAKTVPEFIAYAKANPGKINMAGPTGTTQHITGELFKAMTGVNMLHVPYRGEAQALTDLIGGQVQVYFGSIPASISYIRAGNLRALAVTTATRTEALPDLPTMGDFVPGFEASGWNGIGAPKNTPPEIIDRLNREINASLADPKMKASLAGLGAAVLTLLPAEFGKLIAEDTEKWGKVVKFAGIKLS
jgi:tripartite-type tricarboxylate transporter receptor subunit TctC